jgi:hypothetical protein
MTIRVVEIKVKPGHSTKGLRKSSLLSTKEIAVFLDSFSKRNRARHAPERKSLIARKDRGSARVGTMPNWRESMHNAKVTIAYFKNL